MDKNKIRKKSTRLRKQNECEINRSAQKYACDPAETKVQKKLETKSKTHIMVQAHKLT